MFRYFRIRISNMLRSLQRILHSITSPMAHEPKLSQAKVPSSKPGGLRYGLSWRRIGGLIGALDLVDWWLALSDEERKIVRNVCDPEDRYLTRGTPRERAARPLAQLTGMGNILNRPATRRLSRKVLTVAERFVDTADILDRHFFYQVVIEANYPDRDRDPSALAKAIWACEQQIALAPMAAQEFRSWGRHSLDELRRTWGDEFADSWAAQHREELEKEYALPWHVGYTQLAIILEKQGKYQEAIRLCERAMQQGWAGEWERRLSRLMRKHKG